MALTESTELKHRNVEVPRYNEDGSYTQFGAWMEISKHVILIPKHDSQIQEKIAKAKNMQIIPPPEGLSEGIALLAYKNVPVHLERVRHLKKEGEEGKESDLGYFINWFRYKADDGKENIIFGAFVPEGGTSSEPAHEHGWNEYLNPPKPVIEHYFKLSDGDIYIGQGENKKLMSKYEAVQPEINHFISAASNGVLLMLLENVEGIPDEKIHKKLTPHLN